MQWVFVHTDPPDGTIQVLDTNLFPRGTAEKVLGVLVKVFTLLSAFQRGPKFYPWE